MKRSSVIIIGFSIYLTAFVSACGSKSDTTPVNCDKTLLTTIENFQVWKLNNSKAVVFNAKMTIDADGSPNAYCPDNKGLDFTANAGKPGNWFGIVTDSNGKPVIQKNSDPTPGCYVSPTTLVDKTLSKENPLKYVNSEKIPFIALPPELLILGNIRIGDFAYVYNTKNKKASFAIFADGGPRKKLGEGSVFLAEQLGINKSPRNGGTGKGIIYIIFPRSGKGNGTLRTPDEINSLGQAELNKIGGAAIIDCLQI